MSAYPDFRGLLMVYFSRNTSTGLVKIGASRNPWQRTKTLAGSGWTLAGVLPGNRATERSLHFLFRSSLVQGREFFRATPDLVAFIENVFPVFQDAEDLVRFLVDYESTKNIPSSDPEALAVPSALVRQAMRENGITQQDLADHFSVTRQRIHQLVSAPFIPQRWAYRLIGATTAIQKTAPQPRRKSNWTPRPPTTVRIGDRLRALRTAQGLSQARLASLCGTFASHICNMEANDRPVRIATATAIAASLGVDVWELAPELSSQAVPA